MKLKLIAIFTLSLLAVGCGGNKIAGTYQGSNNVTLGNSSTTTGGGTNPTPNTGFHQVSLTLTESNNNNLTGQLSTTGGGNLVGNGLANDSSGSFAGNYDKNTYHATNVQATIDLNGIKCVGVLAGDLVGDENGNTLKGTVSGSGQSQYGGNYGCGTMSMNLSLTKTTPN